MCGCTYPHIQVIYRFSTNSLDQMLLKVSKAALSAKAWGVEIKERQLDNLWANEIVF